MSISRLWASSLRVRFLLLVVLAFLLAFGLFASVAWQARPLDALEVVYAYLDALALRVRSDHKVVSVPALAAVAVRADGQKALLTLELSSGGESYEAWKGGLDGLGARVSTSCSPRPRSRAGRAPLGIFYIKWDTTVLDPLVVGSMVLGTLHAEIPARAAGPAAGGADIRARRPA